MASAGLEPQCRIALRLDQRVVVPRTGRLYGVPVEEVAQRTTRFWRAHATELDRISPAEQQATLGSFATIYAELASAYPTYGGRAAEIMSSLPLELMLLYARTLVHFIRRSAPQNVIEALLDPRNLEIIKRHLLTADHARLRATMMIAGVEFADSALLNRVISAEQAAVITNLTHSYSYFDIELRLLRENIDRIMSRLPSGRSQMVDLGPGEEKLQVVLDALGRTGKKPTELFLVDCNQTVLERVYRRFGTPGLYAGTVIPVPYSFEELRKKPIGTTADTNVLVTNFGTTFCNLLPDANFEIFRVLQTNDVLLGVYLIPRGSEKRFDMLDAYNNEAMRTQAKIGAMLLGVSSEDIEEKCSYSVHLVSVDMSMYGLGSVMTLLAVFNVNEQIESGLGKVYQPGTRLGGFYSIKYTAEQIELLSRINGMEPHRIAVDDESQVALYHLQQI